ncbi:MAG TPA: hypothetical protein VFC79_14275 [Tissierellaceae bacterium]|nr:hypothetical protein [Tissierellaceae bacterium]
MFTIYDGKLYKVNGKTMVGVDITPTSLKMVKGTEIETPSLNKALTLKEVKIKYQVVSGKSYIFPKPKSTTKKKVDKDDGVTTKTKKSTTKKKVDKDGDKPTTKKAKKSTRKSK